MLPDEVQSVMDKCVRDLCAALVEVKFDQLKDKRWNELEGPAVEAGDWVGRELLKALLEKQGADVSREADVCPLCGAPLETRPDEPQPLQTRRGWISWRQPVRRCPRCRRDFFPQGRVLGCEVDCEQSPSVLEKIVEASVESRSYERAAREMSKLAEVEVSAKQCERVTQRIGGEPRRSNKNQVDRYSRLTLPEQIGGCPPQIPENFWKSRAAVVELDGGRDADPRRDAGGRRMSQARPDAAGGARRKQLFDDLRQPLLGGRSAPRVAGVAARSIMGGAAFSRAETWARPGWRGGRSRQSGRAGGVAAAHGREGFSTFGRRNRWYGPWWPPAGRTRIWQSDYGQRPGSEDLPRRLPPHPSGI